MFAFSEIEDLKLFLKGLPHPHADAFQRLARRISDKVQNG